jgi:hypothetical protein
MDQPVTNEACENRRCEIRELIKYEVNRVTGTVSHNHSTTSDWLVRVEEKIDESNNKMSDKIDSLKNMILYMILAIVLGALGVKLGWI